jgi:hypothetical protein
MQVSPISCAECSAPSATPGSRTTAANDWAISEADALDLFSLLSFVHRCLDNAAVAP